MAAKKSSKKVQEAVEVQAPVKKSRAKKGQIKASEAVVEASHMDSIKMGIEPMAEAPALLSLKPEELWKMRYVEAEIRAASKDAVIAKLTKKVILMQIDPSGLINAEDQKIEAATQAMTISKSEYRQIMAAASERLGVNLSGCAIDPDSGVVIPQS
jgi:hypothetical protein